MKLLSTTSRQLQETKDNAHISGKFDQSAYSTILSMCFFFRKMTKDVCCDGWKGATCNEPICNISCIRGRCVSPNVCQCEEGFGGEACQYSKSKLLSDFLRNCALADNVLLSKLIHDWLPVTERLTVV